MAHSTKHRRIVLRKDPQMAVHPAAQHNATPRDQDGFVYCNIGTVRGATKSPVKLRQGGLAGHWLLQQRREATASASMLRGCCKTVTAANVPSKCRVSSPCRMCRKTCDRLALLHLTVQGSSAEDLGEPIDVDSRAPRGRSLGGRGEAFWATSRAGAKAKLHFLAAEVLAGTTHGADTSISMRRCLSTMRPGEVHGRRKKGRKDRRPSVGVFARAPLQVLAGSGALATATSALGREPLGGGLRTRSAGVLESQLDDWPCGQHGLGGPGKVAPDTVPPACGHGHWPSEHAKMGRRQAGCGSCLSGQLDPGRRCLDPNCPTGSIDSVAPSAGDSVPVRSWTVLRLRNGRPCQSPPLVQSISVSQSLDV
ncbi:hypothetical protein Micbo1qcDRAFT_177226 [Microdochium bolleyi]|uniref:Uncharacterized protein n=1 Tax=Microdochium bolleyi TaxID=196109 RepID=A0A136IWW5_9PEZI|nr:hypothetical protein Micbo1qcDRAFT_177226 [Microdochium bolleyi]